jgi:hypothetical protein
MLNKNKTLYSESKWRRGTNEILTFNGLLTKKRLKSFKMEGNLSTI